MSDIDPTDHALATIASILEHPEPARDAARPVETADPIETAEPTETADLIETEQQPVVDEQPLAPEPVDAHGYAKVGPGPMEAIRFRWTVHRADDGQYYVHETIGEQSAPVVIGPMTGEAAVRLVDERESEAHRRFEILRNEIAGRSSAADFARRGEA